MGTELINQQIWQTNNRQMNDKEGEGRKEIQPKENNILKRKQYGKEEEVKREEKRRGRVNRISHKMRFAVGRLTGRIRRLTKLSRA